MNEYELISKEEWDAHLQAQYPELVMENEELERIRKDKVRMYYAVAGVPERYWHLEWLSDAEQYVSEEGVRDFEVEWAKWYTVIKEASLSMAGGFYLYGSHNSGKTSLAVLAMLSACDFVADLPDPFYLHVGTFVAKRRAHEEIAEQWMARAASASVFVFDDVGSEAGTDYAREQVTAILEARVGSLYPSIYTGNIEPESLEEVVGGRVAVRILRYNKAIRI